MASAVAAQGMVGSKRHLEESPELVSPELALVDPALAERARAHLRLDDEISVRPTGNAAGGVTSSPVIRRPPHAAQAANAAAHVADAVRLRGRRSRLARAGAFMILAFVTLGFAARALNPPDEVETAQPPSLSAVPAVDGRLPSSESVGRTNQVTTADTQTTATSETTAKPQTVKTQTSAKPKTPPKSGKLPARSTLQARTFAWAPARGARRYRVEFFRGGRRVFAARTKRPRLTLPARWTHGGRRYRLTPGEYRWYVWPLLRSGSGIRQGKAIVQAKLSIAG